MLDECKSERLEEILAVFSNAVLKKVLEDRGFTSDSIAQQLAFENFSYTGERTVLSALVLAYKASLRKHLLQKNSAGAQYNDFSDLLNLNNRRIARRHEELKLIIQERGSCDDISDKEIRTLQEDVKKNWSGSDEWLETLLYGDSKAPRDNLIGERFDRVWKHVETGSISDIEGKQHTGLVEQLDARIRDQEARLARWQNFGRTLSKPGTKSPSKQKETAIPQKKIVDLQFNRHQALQIDQRSDQVATHSPIVLEDYSRLIENMNQELIDVNKAETRNVQAARRSLPTLVAQTQHVGSTPVGNGDGTTANEEEWCSATDTEPETSLPFDQTGSTPQTPPTELPVGQVTRDDIPNPTVPAVKTDIFISALNIQQHFASEERPGSLPSPPDAIPPTEPMDSESDLADQILNSVSASSPSPKKSRHTLSLAERTRLSMSRASHSEYSDIHNDVDNLKDLTRLSIRTKTAQPAQTSMAEGDEEKHAALIERTRKSMAGFEAAQKKAQLERRRSVQDAKKKQRESNYFPKVEEEPITPSISAVTLIDEDPDYEMVFKSRPRIKTSPAVSPTRVWGESDE
jgi:hypothetical protein